MSPLVTSLPVWVGTYLGHWVSGMHAITRPFWVRRRVGSDWSRGFFGEVKETFPDSAAGEIKRKTCIHRFGTN